MTSNNQRLHYLLHLVFYLINKLDQINSQNNDDALRSLATSTKLRLPMIVQLGAFASQKYYIVNRLGSNSISHAYEAYMINNGYIDQSPVVLKAFFGDEEAIDQHLTDEADYRKMMKELFVTVDRTNHIVIYGGYTVLNNVFPELESESAVHGSGPRQYDNLEEPSLFHMPNFRHHGGLTRSMFGGHSYDSRKNGYDDHSNDDIISFKNFRKSVDKEEEPKNMKDI
jgi:hypothetical protein